MRTACCLLSLAFAALPAHAQTQKPDAVRGRALYMNNGCFECHNTAGQGGIGPMSGPSLAAREDLPVEVLTAIVRSPPAAMPPYSEKALSDAQLADVHAYLQSLPKLKTAADVPMLRSLWRSVK